MLVGRPRCVPNGSQPYRRSGHGRRHARIWHYIPILVPLVFLAAGLRQLNSSPFRVVLLSAAIVLGTLQILADLRVRSIRESFHNCRFPSCHPTIPSGGISECFTGVGPADADGDPRSRRRGRLRATQPSVAAAPP